MFDVAEKFLPIRVVLVVLLAFLHGIRNERCANDVIPRDRLGDVDSVDDSVDFASLELGVDAMGEESIASFVFEFHDTLFRVTRHLDVLHVFRVDDLLYECSVFWCEVFETHNVNFVDDKHHRFTGKKWFDGMEEFTLFIT